MRNLVAKHARTFNKAVVFKDRTKYNRNFTIDLDEEMEPPKYF